MGQEKRPAMTTTLYDLISALHRHAGVEDDRMVTAIVTHLLRTGQIRCIEKSPTDHQRTRHHKDRRLNEGFVLFARLKSQPTSWIDLCEQILTGPGLAEGACDGRA